MANKIYTFGQQTSRQILDKLKGPVAKAAIPGMSPDNPVQQLSIMKVTSELSASGAVGATLTLGLGNAQLALRQATTLSTTTAVTYTVYNTHDEAIPVDTWIYVMRFRGDYYFVGAIQYCPTVP